MAQMSQKFSDALYANDLDTVSCCISAESPQAVHQAMLAASICGFTDGARLIIEKNKVDMTVVEDCSPLVLAAKNGNLDVVKLFFEPEYNLAISQEHIALAIQWAAYQGELDVLKFLESRGGDIHHDKDRALCLAVRFAHTEVVRWLLENKADPNVHEYFPICNASLSPSFEILKLLVEHGADVHANGETPFLHAVAQGRLDMVQYLIQNGADYMSVIDDAIGRTQANPTPARNAVAVYLIKLLL